ncbi:sortase-dependent protein [Streptomyces sp. NPDC005774]|uniref:sortase-dependent protein n=1 Tax=Streptomyces sp. NPDC005774 TaxID=3364728 RepID=UPI00369EBC3E
MRRTVFSAAALACTAVLASAVPAFADDPTPVAEATATPIESPAESPEPEPESASTPAEEGNTGGVSVVPSGAPDTGAAPESAQPGSDAGLIGGGATAVLAAGGAAVFLVRRRRATGA